MPRVTGAAARLMRFHDGTGYSSRARVTSRVGEKPIDYVCSDQGVILGDLDPTGPVWMAEQGSHGRLMAAARPLLRWSEPGDRAAASPQCPAGAVSGRMPGRPARSRPRRSHHVSVAVPAICSRSRMPFGATTRPSRG